MSLPITPDMRVGELLDTFPEVEAELIRTVPAFGKLRNPILRKTVAQVATLEQAAVVAGISTRELIEMLRRLTGQGSLGDVLPGCGGDCAGGAQNRPEIGGMAPEWLSDAQIRHTVNADELLERGVHPIGLVRQLCGELAHGEILLLRSSFEPEPLLETMRRAGLAVYYQDGRSYFCRE